MSHYSESTRDAIIVASAVLSVTVLKAAIAHAVILILATVSDALRQDFGYVLPG